MGFSLSPLILKQMYYIHQGLLLVDPWVCFEKVAKIMACMLLMSSYITKQRQFWFLYGKYCALFLGEHLQFHVLRTAPGLGNVTVNWKIVGDRVEQNFENYSGILFFPEVRSCSLSTFNTDGKAIWKLKLMLRWERLNTFPPKMFPDINVLFSSSLNSNLEVLISWSLKLKHLVRNHYSHSKYSDLYLVQQQLISFTT